MVDTSHFSSGPLVRPDPPRDHRTFSRNNEAARNALLQQKSLSRRVAVIVFLITLTIPVIFYIGPMRLSVYRFYLLLAFVPLIALWMSGRAGAVTKADVLIVLFVLWASISLTVNHSANEIWEFTGMLAVETLGAYLLGRVMIRSACDFQAMVRVLSLLILACLPLVLFEVVTDRQLLNEVIRSFAHTLGNVVMEPRLGLQRAQGPFEHPILFGVFASSGFSLAYFALASRGRGQSLGFTAIAGLMTFLSLSVGAFLSVIVQVIFIIWDRMMRQVRRRWRLLLILFVAAYVLVDLISNRSPVEVFISYLTFNTGNAYNRVLIWHFGTAEVWRHPLFGIGLHDWQRAYWMSTSMDNFWLLNAVRYGLPALVLLMAAFFLQARGVGKLESRDPLVNRCKTGWLMALGGICIALCTVHLWNATYCYLLFLLGSGAWMLDHSDPPEEIDMPAVPEAPKRPRTIL